MIWIPRFRAASRNGDICATRPLTRSVAPLHQCLSHMSQISIAVLSTGKDCCRDTSRQSPVPLNASIRERRFTVISAAPALSRPRDRRRMGRLRGRIMDDMLSRSAGCLMRGHGAIDHENLQFMRYEERVVACLQGLATGDAIG